MANVALQTAPEPHSLAPQREKLVLQLDDLLAQYLHIIDAYEKARQQLTKHLSTGYFSLAQANFASSTHTRYGQDYYDQRMQASRKIVTSEKDGKARFSAESIAAEEPPSASESSTPKDDFAEHKDNISSAEAEAEAEADNKKDPGPSDARQKGPGASQPEEKKKGPPNDPIRWFGVLVPPALRSAQASFVSAVEGPVVELSTLQKELRQQEIEIGRVRKQIKKL